MSFDLLPEVIELNVACHELLTNLAHELAGFVLGLEVLNVHLPLLVVVDVQAHQTLRCSVLSWLHDDVTLRNVTFEVHLQLVLFTSRQPCFLKLFELPVGEVCDANR